MLGRFGQVWQVFGILDAGDAGRNGLGFAAVGMIGLGAERFELARPALHPEQDAGLAATPQVVGPQAH